MRRDIRYIQYTRLDQNRTNRNSKKKEKHLPLENKILITYISPYSVIKCTVNMQFVRFFIHTELRKKTRTKIKTTTKEKKRCSFYQMHKFLTVLKQFFFLYIQSDSRTLTSCIDLVLIKQQKRNEKKKYINCHVVFFTDTIDRGFRCVCLLVFFLIREFIFMFGCSCIIIKINVHF